MAVYILHFEKAIGSAKHQAKHYSGFTSRNIDVRLREHLAKSNPVPIVRAFVEKGIGYKIGKIWHNEGREFERHIKKVGRNIKDHCLVCREEKIILKQLGGKIVKKTYYVCGVSEDCGKTVDGKPFICDADELKSLRRAAETATDAAWDVVVLHKFTVKVMAGDVAYDRLAGDPVAQGKSSVIYEDIPF